MNNEWNGEKRFWLIGNNFKLFEYFSYILHCRFCLWFACACQFKSIASDWIKVVGKVFSYSFKFIIVKENLESFIAPAVFLFESFFFFFISSCCWTNSWFPVRSNPSSIVAKIQNGKYFRFSSLGPSFVLILIESMMSLNCNELKFCVLWQGQTPRRRRRQSKNSGERDKWIACLCELHWKQTTRKNQIEFVDSPNCPLKRLKAVSTQTKTQWHFHNDFDYVLGHSFCSPSLQFVCVCNFISWSMWVSVSDIKWAQNVNIKIYSFFCRFIFSSIRAFVHVKSSHVVCSGNRNLHVLQTCNLFESRNQQQKMVDDNDIAVKSNVAHLLNFCQFSIVTKKRVQRSIRQRSMFIRRI